MAEMNGIADVAKQTLGALEATGKTEVADATKQTLGVLETAGKTEAEQTIEQLQAMLSEVQSQHAAVLGRYIQMVRDRVDVLPEMIGGETLSAVDATLAQSRAAFERLASRLAPSSAANGNEPNNKNTQANTEAVKPANIPAGGAARRSSSELLAEGGRQLSPFEKIRLGLDSNS